MSALVMRVFSYISKSMGQLLAQYTTSTKLPLLPVGTSCNVQGEGEREQVRCNVDLTFDSHSS